MTKPIHLPRLFIAADLSEGIGAESGEGHAHYLKNVLRFHAGAAVRIFNGRDGEFVGRIDAITKKSVAFTVENRLRTQPDAARHLHLFFAPLKKERMDFLVEKAVELGATDLHPVLTEHADVRKINEERLNAQMVEAAEQCERLDIPTLHLLTDIHGAIGKSGYPVYAALERNDALPVLKRAENDCGILIGPAGGFSGAERDRLMNTPSIVPVSLGPNILRAETAALAALAVIGLGS